MKRYLFKYQISLPTCFYYCSTELQFLNVAGMLLRDALTMDIGAKYFDGNICLLQKAPQVFGRKTHHIRQFEKVYGMHTIITIVKEDYCLMSQLLLNILLNVTLPPNPSFFVHFKHIFVTHPTKISRFSITVTSPPRDMACHPPPPQKKRNSERAQKKNSTSNFAFFKYLDFKQCVLNSKEGDAYQYQDPSLSKMYSASIRGVEYE